MLAIVGKVVVNPVTKVVVCSIAGGLASYFTQVAVAKVYDNVFSEQFAAIESVPSE
jgi:hypothetical protein